MTRLFLFLLTMLFSLSGPATEGNVRIWRSTIAANRGGNVLLDSSVIPGLRQSPNLGGRLLPAENRLVSYVSGPDMRNAAAHNQRFFVPKALDDLPVLNAQPSLDLRINIRGQLPAGPGL